MRGGSLPDWLPTILGEAARIQALATSMDEYNQPFLIAGSTAVAAYIHELLTTDVSVLTPTEIAEGQTVMAALKKPDDLDFKYRRQGGLFEDHILQTQPMPQAPETNAGPALNFSFLQSTFNDCQQYIDIADYRCCEFWEENPIFYPQKDAPFSKLEFHAPREFKRKRMHAAKIGGLDLLGIQDVMTLYTNHETNGNAPKLVALRYILSMLEMHTELAEKYIGQ